MKIHLRKNDKGSVSLGYAILSGVIVVILVIAVTAIGVKASESLFEDFNDSGMAIMNGPAVIGSHSYSLLPANQQGNQLQQATFGGPGQGQECIFTENPSGLGGGSWEQCDNPYESSSN